MTAENELFRYWKILAIISGSWTGGFAGKPIAWNLYRIYAVLNRAIFLIALPCFWVELYFLIRDRNVSKAMENISKMIFVALIQVKYILNQNKGIKKLFKLAIEEESRIMSRPDLGVKILYNAQVKYCKRVVFWLTVLTYISGYSLIGINIYEAHEYFQTVPPELRNVTAKPLAAPMWYPFDTNKHYVLPVMQQWLNIYQTVTYNCTIQALVHSVMIFIKSEFKILQYDLEHFGYNSTREQNGNSREDNLIVLKQLTRKHQDLLEWVTEFNDSIKYLLLLEYSVTSMMLATTLIQIIMSSTELSESIYKCNWYDQNEETKSILHTMMTRCQRPVSLSIGPFADMDLAAAMSTTKLAYTFLSVILSQGNKF